MPKEKTAPQESTDLKILFPEREVVLADESIVLVRPLSLKHLPKVAKAFGVLMEEASKGLLNPAQLVVRSFEELAVLIPYCIDRPVQHIPINNAPEILEHIVELNATEDVVKKWAALLEKVTVFAEAQKSEQDPSKK